jgi:hypothetical protein
VDKPFSTNQKTKFEIRRTEAFREKRRVQNTVRSSRWISPGVFYVPIPDIEE